MLAGNDMLDVKPEKRVHRLPNITELATFLGANANGRANFLANHAAWPEVN